MDESEQLFLDRKASYVQKYRNYLSKKNIPHDNLSDEQVIFSYGKQAEAGGHLDKMPDLARAYRQSNASLQRERDGLMHYPKQFVEGLKKGANTTGGMVFGGIGLVGDTLGISTPGSDSLAEDFMRDAGKAKTTVKSLKDADSFADYMDFLVAGAGEVLPTMGTIMATGGATGLAAGTTLKVAPAVLQKKIVSKALQKEIKKRGPTKSSASLLADKGKAFKELGPQGQRIAQSYASAWGNVAGGVAASGTMGMGEVYTSLLPYTRLPETHEDHVPIEDAQTYSFAFGSAIGALDSIVPSFLGNKALKKFYPGSRRISPVDAARADNYVKKSLFKAMGSGMAIEGSTEATQEFLNIAADKFAKARQKEETGIAEDLATAFDVDFSEQELWRLLDAGVLGMIGGVGAGGAFTLLDNQVQLPKRIQQKQEFDDAVERARIEAGATRSDLQSEIEEKAKKQFKRKTISEGESVVLPNGQQATFVRNVGDGRGLVSYEKDGKKQEVSLPMPLIAIQSDINSNVVTRSNRRQAMQEVASEPVQDTVEESAPDRQSIVDEFKADYADVIAGDEDEAGSEGNQESDKPKESELKKNREAIVEGTKVTKGDMLAYNLLSQGGIYDSEITTDRLIDGDITPSLKNEISNEDYESWWKSSYDTKFESQPSKEEFINSFRRAHKKLHPKGRPTKGDELAEETAREIERKKAEKEEADRKQAEAKAEEKKVVQATARKINLQRSDYKPGDKIKLTSQGAAKAIVDFGLPENLQSAEWTIDSIDSESGAIRVSAEGYTIKSGDPRGFGKPIKEKPSDKSFQEGKAPLSEYHLGDLFFRRGELLSSTFDGNAVLQGSGQKFGENPDWSFWPQVQYIEDEIRRRGVDPKDANARKEAEKDFLSLDRNYIRIDTAKIKKPPNESSDEVGEIIEGESMDALPEIDDGLYTIQYRNGDVTKIVLLEDGWKYSKGKTGNKDKAKPTTLGEIILRGTRSEQDIESIERDGKYRINVAFDGVAFRYGLSPSASDQETIEAGNFEKDPSNGIWKFQKLETDLFDPEQKHVQHKQTNFITDEQKSEEIQNLTEYKAAGKSIKERSDLPGRNLKASGNDTTAIVAIQHAPTGKVFVRSVVKEEGSLRVYSFRRRGKNIVGVGEGASTMMYNDLPSGFVPLSVSILSARQGTLKINFDSDTDYQNWIDSIPQFVEKKIRTLSNLPEVNELLDEYDGDISDTRYELHFQTFINEDGEIEWAENEDGEFVVDEAIGSHFKPKGKRRAWHYIKLDELVEQLNVSAVEGNETMMMPLFKDIESLLEKPNPDKKYKEEIEDKHLNTYAAYLNFIEVGEGTTTETKRPQIDERKFNEFLTEGEELIGGNKNKTKEITKRFLRGLYERAKRGIALPTNRAESLGEDESGKSKLENIPGKAPTDSDQTSIDEVTTTFFGEDPIDAAEKVFFKGISYDQVRIIYDFAEKVVQPEQSSSELLKAAGVDLTLLNSLPKVAPEARINLDTFPTILAGKQSGPIDNRDLVEGISYLRWVKDNFDTRSINELIAARTKVSNADFAYEANVYSSKLQINVTDKSLSVVKSTLSSTLDGGSFDDLFIDRQKELVSEAYTSILKSIRLPSETSSAIQEAFISVADALQGAEGRTSYLESFSSTEGSGVKTADQFKEAIANAEGNIVEERTVNLFIELLKSAKKQVIPKSRIDVTRLFAEHLGLKESAPLTLLQSKFEEAEIATGAIENKTSAPNKAPISNMQDPYGSQTLPVMPEVSEQSIAHGEKIARAQKSNLVEVTAITEEQQRKNQVAMEEVFPSNLPGSNLSGMALESINRIIEEQGTDEGKVFAGEMVSVLSQIMEARSDQNKPAIRFDNTKQIPSTPGVITRGQFIPDTERPTVLINPDFYYGENDSMETVFPITNNKEKDILMLVAMHEVWHGTMEEALHVHEMKTLRGEKSELQDTIDLIDEVIRVAGEEARGTKFASLFLASNPNSRREILNRAWNRRDFAKFLAGIKVSKELQQRVDKNGQGFITSVLDALYGAYLKLLRALGIDADGSALKALLDLNRQLDSEYRKMGTPSSKGKEVFYTNGIEIIRNPEPRDYRQINKEYTSLYPMDRSGDPKVRFTEDADGNRYIWRSDEGMHSYVEPLIEKRDGVKVSQNPDHLFMSDPTRAYHLTEPIGPTNSEVSLDILQEYKSRIYDDYLDAFAEDTDASDVSNVINETPQDRYDRESIELLEPNLRVLLRALEKDDWFGYDYPSQAVMALFEEETYNLYDVSPSTKGAVTRYINSIALGGIQSMSDPISPVNGNVVPEENSRALGKATAAAVNESSIPVAYAAQQIRKILNNSELSVDEIWQTYLKGKTPTKAINELKKKYGEEMEFQTIELHKNSENTRDQARVDALKKIEYQIYHVLKQSADIESDLDPTRPGTIASRIAKYENRTILDEAHLFDRSKYGDRVRERIDSRVATTAQALIEETGEESTDIILNAYREITGREKTTESFRKSLDNVVSKSNGGGIASNKIADIILEVSKTKELSKLDAKSIYEIIESGFSNKDRAIVLSAVLANNMDFIYLAKLSQSQDTKARRDLSTKLNNLARANMGELEALTSSSAKSYFPLGNPTEKQIQKQFAYDRIELLKAQDDREQALKNQLVYEELFKELDVESQRLRMLLGHNASKQLNNGDRFPVMTKIDDGYTMTEVEVKMSNLMQFENYDELKAAIRMNKEYLRDPNVAESNDYRYVKQMTMNAEIMPIWNAQYETGGIFRMHSLKSARERFGNMGPVGREISQMILRFENGYKQYTPEARAIARDWNEAFDNARKAFGFNEGHVFMDNIIGPIIKWNEDQPQISGDKKAFQSGALKQAGELFSGDITKEAKDALLALFDQYEKSAEFQRRIAEKMELKVLDDTVKMRDYMGRVFQEEKDAQGNKVKYGDYLFRNAITRGYLTVPRLLRSDVVQSIVNELPKSGWAKESSDKVGEFSWGELEMFMKSDDVGDATKAEKVEQASEALLKGDVWNKFITPYIKNTSPRELFNQPTEGLKIPRHVLMDAYSEVTSMNGSDAFNAWVQGVYNRLDHKADLSDFTEFKYGILKSLKGRYSQLNQSISDMGKQGLDSSITLAGHLMDSRSQDAIIPIEFLRYTTYDEVTSPALIAKTMENAFFGRNAELLVSKMEQLVNELNIKQEKFGSLASKVGAIPNPRGKQKFSRQQRQKAYLELESSREFDNIPGATGKQKFDNLKNAESQMKSLLGSEVGEGAVNHLKAYLNGDLGPFQDEKLAYELLGLNAYFVLNQPKSGVTNLMSIWDFDSRYGGAVGTSNIADMLFGSWTAAGQLVGGVMANLGIDANTQTDEGEILMPLFFNTHENDVGFRKNLLNVGGGAVKRNQILGKDFRYDILRPFKSALDSDAQRGKKVTNADGKRKYAPFSTRTLFTKPFSYFGSLSNFSIAVSNSRKVSKLVHEVAGYIEDVNRIQEKSGGALLPEDYQVTSEELGKRLSDKIAFDRLNLDLETYGLGTISNLARDYIERRSKGDNRILTKDQVIVSGLIGVNEVALEGGFSTTPAFLNTKYMRWAAPLQKWALNKVKQTNEGIRGADGKVDAQGALLMLATIVALKIPIGLAYTFFWSDWYDEELMGKASPLRPLSKSAMVPLIGPFIEGDPANNLKAMLERVARAGNVGGLAVDFANTMYNGVDTYSYNRGFSLDSRILLMSQLTNIAQAARNVVHMDFDADYANVARPLMYSMGLNGPLQQYNLMSNFLGLDSEERRISNQIGNRHKLRAGIHLLGIESRPMVGGSIGKTRFSASIRRMERAAEADDYKGFNEAYGDAIEASIDRGDENPEDAVMKGFKRRNLKTGISRYKLSDEEWQGILNLYEKEAAQPLIDAMNMHQKYVDILDASKPSSFTNFQKSKSKPVSYDELIRRSLSL